MILNMVSDLLRSSPAKFGSVSMTYGGGIASDSPPFLTASKETKRILCCGYCISEGCNHYKSTEREENQDRKARKST